MKKILTLSIIIVTIALIGGIALAQVQFGVPKKMSTRSLNISFFDDYYPLGTIDSHKYAGIFDRLLSDFEEKAQFTAHIFESDTYEDTVRKGAKGRSDILLGMYSDTPLYEDWKYIYPAMIDNPIHLVMLPSRISEVKNIDDLKQMKGAMDSREQLSTFVQDQLSLFNIEKVDNSYDLYGKLMRGEVDYIFTSYWFGMTEMMKLGLNDMLSISKKSIWNMPVFLGIAKTSRERDYLVHNFTQLMQNQETRDKIKARAIEILEQIKQETQGTVPPSYVLENQNSN